MIMRVHIWKEDRERKRERERERERYDTFAKLDNVKFEVHVICIVFKIWRLY